MGLTASASSGEEFEVAPEGLWLATCVQVIDQGTQRVEWQGSVKHQHKVLIGWELADQFRKDGQPFLVWQRYTLSLDDRSNLYGHLVSWRGRKFTEDELAGFDIAKLAGVPCQLQVIHNENGGRTYANVHGVLPKPKDVSVPAPKTDVFVFNLDSPDMARFESFGENLQNTIRQSPEWQKSATNQPAPAGVGMAPDDDIPF